ncbi:MAG: hypothetical protein ACJ8I9_05925 [Chthoniobacterales bacterium]
MDWREIRVPLAAAVTLCAVGLVFGVLIGRAISTNSQTDAPPNGAAVAAAHANRFTQSSYEEASKLVLGNIATVPFQELYTVLSSRSPAELTEVAQQLKALPAGHDKEQKVAKFFKAWAHFDAAGALKAAVEMESPASREKAISAVVEGADATAAETLAKTINALPADLLTTNRQRSLTGMAAAKWSEIDAPSAAAFIDTLAAGGPLFGIEHTIAMNWALSDPSSALTWAQQRDAMANWPSRMATDGAVAGWWQKDATAAESYVATHLTGRTDRQLATTIASQIFNSDPQRAIDWVSQLPDADARRQAESMIARQLSWSDPKGAADWAASLPDDVRSSVLTSAISGWAQSNPSAAADWLGALNGPARDQGISAYINAVSYRDPANALGWANAISDPQMRDNSVDRVVRGWMERDPQQASAWLQTSPLTDDAKKRLLATAPPPGG